MSFASSSLDINYQSRRPFPSTSSTPQSRSEASHVASHANSNSSNNFPRKSVSARAVNEAATLSAQARTSASAATRSRTLSNPFARVHRPSTAPGPSITTTSSSSAAQSSQPINRKMHTSTSSSRERNITHRPGSTERLQTIGSSSRSASFSTSLESTSKTTSATHATSDSSSKHSSYSRSSRPSSKRSAVMTDGSQGVHSGRMTLESLQIPNDSASQHKQSTTSLDSSHPRGTSLSSLKISSDVRSDTPRSTHLTPLREHFVDAASSQRKPAYEGDTIGPPASPSSPRLKVSSSPETQANYCLSTPSISPLRSSPNQCRPPSVSLSSMTSLNMRRTDSLRGQMPASSPALDALPQRLGIEDMKRLLSKPASVMSGSESEGYRGLATTGRGKTGALSSDDDLGGGGGYRSSPGRMSGAFVSRLNGTRGVKAMSDDEELSLNVTLPLPTTNLRRSVSAEKKRNLLRRRPSADRRTVKEKEKDTSIFPASYTPSSSKPRGSSKLRAVSMSLLPRSRDSEAAAGSGLTPASALVMEYKQRQEAAAMEKEGNNVKPNAPLTNPVADINVPVYSPNSPISHTPQLTASPPTTSEPAPITPDDQADIPPSTPFYTVFGSKSGKVVAVGGPEDSWSELSLGAGLAQSLGAGLGIDREYPERSASVTAGSVRPRSMKPASSLGKSLSRKISGRWKKGSAGDEDIEWERVELPPHKLMERMREGEQDAEHGQGRQIQKVPDKGHEREMSEGGSLNLRERRVQRRKIVVPEAEPLTLSIEEPPRPADYMDSPTTLKAPTANRLVTPQSDVEAVSPSPVTRRSESGPGGSKLWKLMKRLSTGGLREKYTEDNSLEAPPPLPALPNYLSKKSGPKSMDGHETPPATIMSEFAQSRPSLATPRLSQSQGSPSAFAGRSSSSPASPAAFRPSTTTRSSSPVSSDVASSKFFNRTHSQRSSTSSYGEVTIPPVPNTVLGQHIIPPHELYKFTLANASDDTSIKGKGKSQSQHSKDHRTRRSASSPEKWSRPTDAGAESFGVSPLPLPHSQRRTKSTKVPNREDSPSIPQFSNRAPINTFSTRKAVPVASPGEHDGVRALSPGPPPRPSRSPYRPSPASSESSSRVSSPPLPPPPALPASIPQASSPDLKRMSTTSHSTARPRSYASTLGATPALTAQFREKPSQATARTEQEKADMWDDLLERSARAGGTLHLQGADILASDQLRFSLASNDLDSEDAC